MSDLRLHVLERRDFFRQSILAGIAAIIPLELLLAKDNIESLAEDIYIWGLPRVRMFDYLDSLLHLNIPPNQIFYSDALSTPTRSGIGPSVDLLYGSGWLSLTKDPVVLSVPATYDRYYSIQLIDEDANSFAYVGRRATGTKAGNYLIAGPGWRGAVPMGMTAIRSPSERVWLLARTFVAGSKDLVQANAIQAQYGLTPLPHFPRSIDYAMPKEQWTYFRPKPRPNASGATFFDRLGETFAHEDLSPTDRDALARMSAGGVGVGKRPSSDPSTARLLSEAIHRGDQRIRDFDPNTYANGWSVNLHAAAFIKNPLAKAAFNRVALGGHIAEEGLYFIPSAGPAKPNGISPTWSSVGPDGKALSGTQKYRLRFPAGQLPPVNAFWSLTLYDHTWHIVGNPIGRYAIRDRTEGLMFGSDGSLELSIQAELPASGAANWLPAPTGPFELVLRTYQPKTSILNGNYRLPPLQII